MCVRAHKPNACLRASLGWTALLLFCSLTELLRIGGEKCSMAKRSERKHRKSPNEIQNHCYLSNVLAFSSNRYQDIDFLLNL